jgi:hypothetical protein
MQHSYFNVDIRSYLKLQYMKSPIIQLIKANGFNFFCYTTLINFDFYNALCRQRLLTHAWPAMCIYFCTTQQNMLQMCLEYSACLQYSTY